MPPVETAQVKKVVIVGAGVSGSLVAVHLIRGARCPLEITLVEKNPPFGRGLAYSAESEYQLLNVPAGNMSLFEDKPGDFVAWVGERVGRSRFPASVSEKDFLPRRIFGDYSYQVLLKAREEAPPHVKVNFLRGEVIDIEERTQGYRVSLADGARLPADTVVLALGVLPGEYPVRRPLRFYKSRRYVHVPWGVDVLEGVGKNDDVLLVGASLTAADVAVQLVKQGHKGRILALSRRGLKPHVHVPSASFNAHLDLSVPVTTVRAAVHWVRQEVKRASALGIGWRSVIEALRPHSQRIWVSWSWEERSRFMRHVRPFWDNHRHRLPPETADALDALEKSGQLSFIAGRLENLVETETGAEAVIRKRRSQERETFRVGRVINCTGPRSDYSKYQHPLFVNLLARGLIDHDPLALGIRATEEGEVYRYRGAPTGGIFSLGSPLKSALWECTAVPEIRIQAHALARKLLGILEKESPAAASTVSAAP